MVPGQLQRRVDKRALPQLIDRVQTEGRTGLFLAVRPTYGFHIVSFEGEKIAGLTDVFESGLPDQWRVFGLRNDIFDYMEDGDEDLVVEPFRRLIEKEQLIGHVHDGFWAPMDTLKDRQTLEAYSETGRPPWAVWLDDRETAPPLSALPVDEDLD